MKYEYDDHSSSHYSDIDVAYMQSLSAAVVQRSPKYLMTMIVITLFLVFVAIIWMGWAEIDVVVRGNGKVIPASQVQHIQSLEGGIVSEILVKEGDQVEINEALVKISDVAFASSFAENRLLYNELLAKSIRLKAEANNTEFIVQKSDLVISPDALKREESLFMSNRQQLHETLSIYEEQVNQQQSTLEETLSKQRQLRKSLDLLRQEIKIKDPLVRRRIISEVEYLQVQQREAEVEGELDGVSISLPRIRSMVEEGKGKLEQARLEFRNKSKRELNEVLAEISRIAEAQNALGDRVSRTTLRSPVKGIVQRLYTNTIGGVITPGSEIMEIIPFEDTLLVEGRIKPADIAEIGVGQNARLKFTAYDFAIHGSVKGTVAFVSADTITDDEGMSYYLARIRPEKPYLGHKSKQLPIKVGMASEVDIITDKKTILEYLLKPINRGLERALKEG
ncbi:MAG: HlyD family type I secretion periplasmic adaptor subunit [Gammaproteobacteria bacterium]|nr:HlyD family type I secretion periplasmic adaptor subunit [Gammaproteobacteria bacterium]